MLLPSFGESFLSHHAGKILLDPEHAIVELVANAWDAGAHRVDICWPEDLGQTISIRDDGHGMTADEFRRRWLTLNYNRLAEQGGVVEFPSGSGRRPRNVFGHNGVGRHSMFCFSNEYIVETTKQNITSKFLIQKSYGTSPFNITEMDSIDAKTQTAHGTCISADAVHQTFMPSEKVVELIGSRFVADPEFCIYVNDRKVKLEDLDHLCEKFSVPIDNFGSLEIRRYDSERSGRSRKTHGVAWWVNGRLVGQPSWHVYDRPLLDSRRAPARRFTYVVMADALKDYVKSDWSGFHSNSALNEVRRAVAEFIESDLRGIMHDLRRERKRSALANIRTTIKTLPLISREQLASFAEEVQVRCPSLSDRDLDSLVETLAKLELSRSGYELLGKLANLKGKELDSLDELLERWTVSDMRRVLDELRYRLELIARLQELVEKSDTDELHELQPLFERGLWMFGPEFESASFISNRTLATIVRTFFGMAVVENPRNRPDFVAIPDSSIGIYTCDAFDEHHNTAGYSRVIVVELKRGGFELTYTETDQALNYARRLHNSGKLSNDTSLICHVLGSKMKQIDMITQGNIRVIPQTYDRLLRQAHARTFHLLGKIESRDKWQSSDEELNSILSADEHSLFR